MALARLIEQGRLWRGQVETTIAPEQVESSGYAQLDRHLPGGGWQRGQLVELLCDGEGQGELRLLWPLLRRIRSAEQLVLWVDPPHQPYPLALQQAGVPLSAQRVVRTRSLKERLWVLEQALKSGCCPLVLGWLEAQVPTAALRRLQLAAAEGQALGWVVRPASVAGQHSPAAYRLQLQSLSGRERGRPGEATRSGATRSDEIWSSETRSDVMQVDVTLLKRRGGWPLPPQPLDLPAVI